ncbi:serine phosphatase RsbU (regulator of sigma subunit) [Thermonema lapsum]|uniref:Serine phosphatase RsbU (Regulator of sigma subunit) n=1 Tax=Thermonema lapsum TaxID=28195 RepID=A0A846MTT6_9BACT|nr:PP2C family protein-serine/threonine phosphatase [Thermonema lapsum]NIK74841.1 serine phosphatase RsbU (regulator of sigma subunit) [Thermonema lapsum]
MWQPGKEALKSYLYANILGWLLLFTANTTAYILLSVGENWLVHVDIYLQGAFINIFLIACYFWADYKAEKYREASTLFHLNRQARYLLLAMLLGVFVQLCLTLWHRPLLAWAARYVYISYLAHILLFALVSHVMLFTYHSLLLKKAPKRVHRYWTVFAYLLLSTLIFNYFRLPLSAPPVWVSLLLLGVMALMLSMNLRWVAYLDINEKGRAIAMIALALFAYAYFVLYFYNYHVRELLEFNIVYNVYLLAVAGFVLLYSLLAMLVLLFNIPISRIFESKLKDILAFQELTQSLQISDTEEALFESLLQQAYRTAQADAVILEAIATDGMTTRWFTKNIPVEEARRVKAHIQNQKLYNALLEALPSASLPQKEVFSSVFFKTHHSFAIVSRSHKLGELLILRYTDEPFQQEQIEMIDTFVKQVGVAIENKRLIQEIINTEKYKKELEIAKRVQQSLLPAHFPVSDKLSIQAVSTAANEVGGDYYDFYLAAPDRLYLALGDVSGKGTSAAFHMAEVKGIFQGLAPLELPLEMLAKQMNQAVNACMPKGTFVALSLLYINTTRHTIDLLRGGHCFPIYYEAAQHRAHFIKQPSIGMGIVNNDRFLQLSKAVTLTYRPGDVLLLYSDGITEARNKEGEEFGVERLMQLIQLHAAESAEQIMLEINRAVNHFLQDSPLRDDYTLLVVKFKP